MGLLLLRGFVSFTLLAQSVEYIASPRLSALSWVLVTLGLACAGCLLLGFMTPIAAILTGLGAIGVVSLGLPQSELDLIVLALAIVLLGPGAFSLDARMFGRREIFIPHSTRPSKS